MSMFVAWLKKRELREDSEPGSGPADQFKFNDRDMDYADDYDHIQNELFKSVMNKYPEETMQFLNGIGQRGDEEILSLLRKLQKDASPEFKEPQHSAGEDEVVPAAADRGHGGETD